MGHDARLMPNGLSCLQGSGNVPDEPAHIKEALSRVIVEITKREWPQNWSSLLPDLNSICGLGVWLTHLFYDITILSQ